jgi:hypothetical protein
MKGFWILDHKQDKVEAGEIVVENRFLKWLDNFWYYHKWTVIVVSFFLIVGIICFTQCASKDKSDLRVTYAGDFVFSPEQKQQMIDLLETLAPEDKNGKRQTVNINTHYIRSYEKLQADYKEDMVAFQNAKSSMQQNLDVFVSYIKTGDSAFYFVSEDVYKMHPNLKNLMRPLSHIYGDAIPTSAYDEYAIRLGDTEFYQYYEIARMLPADTLIFMPAKLQMGPSSDSETYAYYEQLYRALVDFKAP